MSSFAQPTHRNTFSNRPTDMAISARRLWTGRVLSGLAVAFLLFDGGAKLAKPIPVQEAMTHLGFPQSTTVAIGILLLVCTVLYVIPRTAVLGAVLLSAYLGGAVAANLRVSGPSFPVVFPILFGVIVWAGLYLRDARVRSMLL